MKVYALIEWIDKDKWVYKHLFKEKDDAIRLAKELNEDFPSKSPATPFLFIVEEREVIE